MSTGPACAVSTQQPSITTLEQPRWAPQMIRVQSWTTNSNSTECEVSGLSMPPSCRKLCRATQMHQQSWLPRRLRTWSNSTGTPRRGDGGGSGMHQTQDTSWRAQSTDGGGHSCLVGRRRDEQVPDWLWGTPWPLVWYMCNLESKQRTVIKSGQLIEYAVCERKRRVCNKRVCVCVFYVYLLYLVLSRECVQLLRKKKTQAKISH